MTINRRDLLLLLSKGLIGSLVFPFVSCSDERSLTGPCNSKKRLTDEQADYTMKFIDDFFIYNLSGERIKPHKRFAKYSNNIFNNNECGYDWILVVTKYEFIDIVPLYDHCIANILFEVQGILQGYDWKPYKVEEKKLTFKIKIFIKEKIEILNMLPPICYPQSINNHLQELLNSNLSHSLPQHVELLDINNKINYITHIMNTL